MVHLSSFEEFNQWAWVRYLHRTEHGLQYFYLFIFNQFLKLYENNGTRRTFAYIFSYIFVCGSGSTKWQSSWSRTKYSSGSWTLLTKKNNNYRTTQDFVAYRRGIQLECTKSLMCMYCKALPPSGPINSMWHHQSHLHYVTHSVYSTQLSKILVLGRRFYVVGQYCTLYNECNRNRPNQYVWLLLPLPA